MTQTKHSNTPEFANLVLTNFKNPGKQFSEIYEALLDLRTISPNSNEPKLLLCILDHLLVWFGEMWAAHNSSKN